MFIDEITNIEFSAGHGGAGKVSFGKMAKSGPDGGNGGAGGDLYIESTSDLTLLSQFATVSSYSAQNGEPGRSAKSSGRRGDDMTIYIPFGTKIVDLKSGEEFYFEKPGERILLCKGGKGGRGNFEFRSPRRTTPKFAQPGMPGDTRVVSLTLTLLADYGFVGFPNAGKSSLLNSLTNAKAKVGSYAFTTLSPNLGVCDGKILADLPGLIEGASSGRGLGINFLKHAQKLSTIFHCVSCENDDVYSTYKKIRKELSLYDKGLLKKKEIVLLTKIDMFSQDEVNEKIKALKTKTRKKVLGVSIYTPETLTQLKEFIS